MTEFKDLIEKLRDPKQAQPFGLRSPEEQEVLKKARKRNCLIYMVEDTWETPKECEAFWLAYVYILKPGYEPTPEYDDRDVYIDAVGDLMVAGMVYSMIAAVRKSTFVGFFVYPGTPGEHKVGLEDVATRIYQGHKVVARFRVSEETK